MHPAVAEVVLVGQVLAAALEQLVKIKVLVAVHAAFLSGVVAGILDATQGDVARPGAGDGAGRFLVAEVCPIPGA